jgi:hypothetical protein
MQWLVRPPLPKPGNNTHAWQRVPCRSIIANTSLTGHSREASATTPPHITQSRQRLRFFTGRAMSMGRIYVLHKAFVIEACNLADERMAE